MIVSFPSILTRESTEIFSCMRILDTRFSRSRLFRWLLPLCVLPMVFAQTEPRPVLPLPSTLHTPDVSNHAQDKGKGHEVSTVIEALIAARKGDGEARGKALKESDRIRKDPDLSRQQRFAVALEAEQLVAAVASKNSPPATSNRLRRAVTFAVADKLRGEFGACPETDKLYATTMNRAAPAVARQKAEELLRDPKLTPYLKKQAALAVAREALIGKKVPVQFRTEDGQRLDLRRLPAQPTVLIFTAPGEDFRRIVSDGKIRWIRVSLDPKARPANSKAPTDSATMISAHEPLGFRSPLCQRLHAQPGRTVYVFDRTGALRSFGALADLSDLTATVVR